MGEKQADELIAYTAKIGEQMAEDHERLIDRVGEAIYETIVSNRLPWKNLPSAVRDKYKEAAERSFAVWDEDAASSTES